MRGAPITLLAVLMAPTAIDPCSFLAKAHIGPRWGNLAVCGRAASAQSIEERKAVADLGGIEEKRAKPGGDQEVVRWSTLAMPLLTVPLTKPRWRQGAHMCDTNRNASARQKCYAGCLTGNCICRRCQEAQ